MQRNGFKREIPENLIQLIRDQMEVTAYGEITIVLKGNTPITDILISQRLRTREGKVQYDQK